MLAMNTVVMIAHSIGYNLDSDCSIEPMRALPSYEGTLTTNCISYTLPDRTSL